MFFTVKKLSKQAIDPARVDGNIFHLLSPRRFRIDPCERTAVSFDISLTMPSGIMAQVLPIPDLLYTSGVLFPVSYFSSGQNIEVVFINNSLPDFLFIKNKTSLASAHFFGDTNTFFIEKGDEVARLLFTKTEEMDLKYD